MYSEKILMSIEIIKFKEAHGRFIKALNYVATNEPKLKADSARWEKITKNFRDRFEAPLDSAWQTLSKEDQKTYTTLYLARKASCDETVKKVMETFNAKVIKVKEDESPSN